ncbi:MAG: hypothetical protein IJW28_01375, partial [Clostridia bacterium]|nr:hypothetical protein [Clostridia bacterium]
PFTISNAEELKEIGANDTALAANYVIIKDINLAGINWEPIGSEAHPFTGTLSGLYRVSSTNSVYNKITGMTINADKSNDLEIKAKSYYGLFAVIGNRGVVEDLIFTNYSINVKGYRYNNIIENYNVIDYIGALAGVNHGTIRNCTFNDGTMGTIENVGIDSINSVAIEQNYGHTLGITFDINNQKDAISEVLCLGGVVGYNEGVIMSSAIVNTITCYDYGNEGIGTKVDKFKAYVGGVVGYNGARGEVVYDPIQEGIGTMECSILTMINPEQNPENAPSLVRNPHTATGGVAGFNVGAIVGGVIRTYIYGYNNVGGIAGINAGVIRDNLVIPTINANVVVGGVAGHALATTVDYLTNTIIGSNYIASNKVQFVEYNDRTSIYNTAIYAAGDMGGLVGVYEGEYTLDTSTYGFTASMYGNSVYSYYARSVSILDLGDKQNKYFGDIVVKEYNEDHLNVSSFVGYVKNGLINTGYAKANVVLSKGIVSNDTAVVFGGVIGKAQGVVSIYNMSVYGDVICSNPYNNRFGNFIGDATLLNYVNDAYLYDYAEGQWDGQKGSAPSGAALNSFNFETTGLDANYFILDKQDYIYYGYANVVYSYSFITLTTIMNAGTSFMDGFAGYGEHRKIVRIMDGEAVNTYIKVGNTVKLVDLYITNLLAYNSFYIGFETEYYVSVNNVELNIPTNNTLSFTADNIANVYYGNLLTNNSVKYYLSYYQYEYADNQNVSYVYYNNYSNYYIDINNGNNRIDDNNGDVASLRYKMGQALPLLNNGGSYTTLKSIYVCDNANQEEENTGLKESGAFDTPVANYMRYQNSTANAGIPIQFAREHVQTIKETDFVNLIIDLYPEDIWFEFVNSDKAGIWDVETIRVNGTGNARANRAVPASAKSVAISSKPVSTPKTTAIKASNETITKVDDTITLFYYELDTSNLTVVSDNVIMLNPNESRDMNAIYTEALFDLIEESNTYKLSDILDLSILPGFLQNGFITVKSSNENIVTIYTQDGEIYIKVSGTGLVTFTIASLYDTTVSATFNALVAGAVTGYNVKNEAGQTLSPAGSNNVDEITVVKDIGYSLLQSNKLSLNTYIDELLAKDPTNITLKAIKSFNKQDLRLVDSGYNGVRYYLINNETGSIFFDTDDIESANIKMNGENFKCVKVTSKTETKYIYIIDMDEPDNVVLTGIDEGYDNTNILVVPFLSATFNNEMFGCPLINCSITTLH